MTRDMSSKGQIALRRVQDTRQGFCVRGSKKVFKGSFKIQERCMELGKDMWLTCRERKVQGGKRKRRCARYRKVLAPAIKSGK